MSSLMRVSGAGILVRNDSIAISSPSSLHGTWREYREFLEDVGRRMEARGILCWVLFFSVPKTQSNRNCVCTKYLKGFGSF